MCFPQTRIANHQNGLSFGDVVAAREFKYELLLQTGHGAEIKVCNLFENREACSADALGMPVALALDGFVLSQSQQVFLVGMLLLECIISKRCMIAHKRRQLERMQGLIKKRIDGGGILMSNILI